MIGESWFRARCVFRFIGFVQINYCFYPQQRDILGKKISEFGNVPDQGMV